MLTLFYSPHSTSIDNEARRASGYADVPLSERGRQQAQELGQHYAKETIDVVFPSDLQRAVVTAEIAFSWRGLPIVPDARLRECDYGQMTQQPVEQIDEEFPRRVTDPFPGGESVQMVVQRVGDFLREVVQKYDGQTIVVIGHKATKYGLLYWSGNALLEEIVRRPWEWRDIPIWHYQLDAHTLAQRPIIK